MAKESVSAKYDFDRTIYLPPEMICSIRRQLNIGLLAMAEVERALIAIKFHRNHGTPVPNDCVPISSVDDDDWLTNYAEALRYLDFVEEVGAEA